MDVETQSAVCDLVFAFEDWDVAALLCRLDELDPDVDQRLGAIDALKVRVAWLSRPGRTEDDVADKLDRESRQSVLAVLAATEGLPDRIYDAVLARCKGVVSLVAFVAGPAPIEMRCTALRRLSERRWTLSAAQVLELGAAAGKCPELAAAVLRWSNRPDLIVAVLDDAEPDVLDGLDADVVAHVVDVVVTDAFATFDVSDAFCAYQMERVGRRAVKVLNLLRCDADVRAAASELFESRVTEWRRTHAKNSMVSSYRSMLAKIVTLLGLAPSLGEQEAALAERIVAGGRDAVAAASSLVTLAGTPGHDDLAAAAARHVAADPSTPVDALRVLCKKWGTLATTAAAKMDVSDPVRVAGVADLQTGAPAVTRTLQRASDPVAAFRVWSQTDTVLAPTVLASMGIPIDSELIEHLPAVTPMVSYRDELRPVILAVGDWLFDRFGADQARWRLFSELAEGSQATLGELVELVELSVDTAAA
jgi:hypothetical protein